MKKSIVLILVAGMLSFSACGPSAKEREAEEARVRDSIANDSTMAAQAAAEEAMRISQDSLARIAQDSAMSAMQDSIAMAKTPGKKPAKPRLIDPGKKDQKPEDVKPGTGRG